MNLGQYERPHARITVHGAECIADHGRQASCSIGYSSKRLTRGGSAKFNRIDEVRRHVASDRQEELIASVAQEGLMRLVNNPESLEKYTHIIMDEVHERDLDIDFSLVVIKHLLGKIFNGVQGGPAKPGSLSNLKFKLLLMSATFNTELFRHYFSRSSICDIEKKIVYEGASEKLTQADLEL